MRVLHAISSIDRVHGGPTVALDGLIQAQVQAGIQVSVVSTYLAGADLSLADSMRRCGVSVTTVGPCSGRLVRHPRLASALREAISEVDVVHIHALWEDIQHQAAVAARRAHVPYVVTPHGMLDHWSLSQSRWPKRLYLAVRLRRDLNAAAMIHFTAAAERDASATLGLSPRTIVEPLGIDLGEFNDLPTPGRFRAKHPQVGDRPMVLFLGRAHPVKGLDLLIPSFAQGAPRGAVLVLAGPASEDYRSELQQIVERNGLADRVVWTGMLRGRERVEALVDADLFCLPSRHENFGIAVVEALAAGLPVVISDQVAICNEVRQAGVGEVVQLQVDQIARSLGRWLSDGHLRAEASAKAATFVRVHYDWRNIGQHWLGHYNAIAGRTTLTSAR